LCTVGTADRSAGDECGDRLGEVKIEERVDEKGQKE
jgi:hypothetical protein